VQPLLRAVHLQGGHALLVSPAPAPPPLLKQELVTEEIGESTGTGQKNFSVNSGCEVSHTIFINVTQVQSI